MEDRRTYIDKMAAKLKEWDAELQKLEAKADTVKADMKAEYREQLANLHSKKDEAQQKLNQIKETSEGAWKELKDGIENSWKIMGDSIKNAIEKFQ
ncbi:MAG: hypothetical protein P8Y99_15465 [Calditrichaceae bacterium]|jgi:uncharacterized phage infection (PIP) family protein YhgE